MSLARRSPLLCVACGIIIACLAISCFIPGAALAEETIILSVTLNSIPRGEFFLKRSDSGRLFIRREDLRRIGLKQLPVPVTTIENDAYVSLTDLQGVTTAFDDKKLMLDLQAKADMVDLPKEVRDFGNMPGQLLPRPPGTSSFLNYRLDYGSEINVAGGTWSATGQAGIRQGNLLFLSDGIYQHQRDLDRAVRLTTSLNWDRPGKLARWVAGDILATAGEPSGPLNLGGISYISSFSIEPGLITYPVGEFSGMAAYPSEAEIYVNGILIRRERLSPGEYRFRNLPVTNGTNMVDILVRDPFGAESHFSNAFYLSDRLLRAGLHDYGYSAGFLRRDFGSASDRYGQPVVVARHNVGLSDFLTAGVGAEAGKDLVNVVPRAVFRLNNIGIINLLAGGSLDRDQGSGGTIGGGYLFQSRNINYQLSLRHSTQGYRTLASRQNTDPPLLEAGTGLSLGTPFSGSIGLDGTFMETYAGQIRRSLGVSYSRSLTKTLHFSASWRTTWGTSSENTIFTGLTYIPGESHTISATYQTFRGGDREALAIQKSLPIGEGFGYRGTVERERSNERTVYLANPVLQYNGPYGSYSADYQGKYEEQGGGLGGNYLLSAAGAIVYAGGHIGLTRPVSDSFAMVHLEGLADTKVLLDSQVVARTNADGLAIIPNMRSYQQNTVSFDDHQIPPNYLIKNYTISLSPGQWGGACIAFPVAR
ncbi:MAG: fimbrial biogenesis outer membrane usher protein, partial [Verrucomicrobia bacterium]|nr:fimbrial biogenesis outer membrane usher protein [Deltaproteobacteria bacterium]